MDCRDPDVIYTAEINDWRSQKILLKPPDHEDQQPGEGVTACHALSLPVWPRRSSCVGGSLVAQSGVPELNYSAVDLLKTPANVYVGEVAGVGANSKGQIFVYTRTGHPYATLGDNRTFSHGGSRLFVFDNSGKFVSEWGQDVYGFNAAIGLRVDPQDNVWTIDVAANQVVKFNPDGSVGLVLGRKPEAIGVRPECASGRWRWR